MEGSRVDIATVIVVEMSLLTTASSLKSDKWMLDSYCSKHMYNDKLHYSDFVSVME